jgi:hypothetical protein
VTLVKKLEARISKFETNSKSENRKTWHRQGVFRVFFFVLRICFGFRVSDFEFLAKASPAVILLISTTFADAGSDRFIVHTVNGADVVGPLAQLGPDGSVRLGGAQPATINAADVVTIRRTPVHLPPHPDRAVVVLTHGDCLPFDADRPVKLEEGRLFVHLRPKLGDEPVRLPRAFIALLWFAPAEGTERPDRLSNRLANTTRPRDVVLLRNGDQLNGTLNAIDPVRGAQVETGGRDVTVPLSRLAAIAFSTELQARLRPPKNHRHVVLTNGGRLTFSTLELDSAAARLTGKTLLGTRLKVPLDRLAACEPRSENVLYLSDLKPKTYEHTPFFSVTWPLTADTSVSGGSLRLAGNTFDKGLGVHTKSSVSYALAGKFRWFEAVVGLDDDSSGRRSQARLRVLVDGKPQNLGPQALLRFKASPLTLRINIAKATELTLVTDFGDYSDVLAHVNWADARLIR